MRVLAVDHGLARCGLAISDATGTISRPLEPVEPPDAAAIARIAEAEGAGEIGGGLPPGLDGSEGDQARLVLTFCEELASAATVTVETWDERLTTAMAGASRRSGARAAEDSLAAAHLLDSYLVARERRPARPPRGP